MALGVQHEPPWLAPCGSDFPAADAPCSTEILKIPVPDQQIVVIRGGLYTFAVEYLRYVKEPSGSWRFSGEYNVFSRNSPSHHKLISLWNRPFLSITSDWSQNGAATQQLVESWFDLAQPDFNAVFSFTPDGGQWRFGFGVDRTMHATYRVKQTGQVEIIELTAIVQFASWDPAKASTAFLGVYARPPHERTFRLHSAFVGLDRRTPLPMADFADLIDPSSSVTNEKLMVWALPGLKRIATGSDQTAMGWLRCIVDYAKDTPEKRTLLDLLAKAHDAGAAAR